MWRTNVFMFLCLLQVYGKMETDETWESGGDRELDDSSEQIGPVVTQVTRHPYAASLMKNSSYMCSAVILNTYWVITLSKCFDSDVISSYVTHKKLGNYTIRVGSSYNNKEGSLYKIKMLFNNFDLRISTIKLEAPLVFGAKVQAVKLPNPDDEVSLGYLASMLAWTPTGHIRVVNAPVIEASICESSTKMLPGHYICIGGVQDPDRNFCRQDNGGAVIQNNTLIGISAFVHTCALYPKTHPFPKVSSFSHWLDTVIWDENNRPTTPTTTTASTTTITANATESHPEVQNTRYPDPGKFMLTLPFDPVNVPLVPGEDNMVMPRMSLYEAYLQNIARAKTSTTPDPNGNGIDDEKKEWLGKYGKMLMPPMYQKRYEYEYN